MPLLMSQLILHFFWMEKFPAMLLNHHNSKAIPHFWMPQLLKLPLWITLTATAIELDSLNHTHNHLFESHILFKHCSFECHISLHCNFEFHSLKQPPKVLIIARKPIKPVSPPEQNQPTNVHTPRPCLHTYLLCYYHQYIGSSTYVVLNLVGRYLHCN